MPFDDKRAKKNQIVNGKSQNGEKITKQTVKMTRLNKLADIIVVGYNLFGITRLNNQPEDGHERIPNNEE